MSAASRAIVARPRPRVPRGHLDCYGGDRFAESMRDVRRYHEQLPELAALLPRITTPVTIVNVRVVPLSNGWEEAPAEYARSCST